MVFCKILSVIFGFYFGFHQNSWPWIHGEID